MKFKGRHMRSLDPKGRLMLPPEFRDIAISGSEEGRLMLTNFDGCVACYPMPVWNEIEERFSNVNLLDKSMRDFQRFFISGAEEIVIDKQGRILLPNHLRDYGNLHKDLVLVGVVHKFEIWDRERFEGRQKETEANFDRFMDNMAQSGIELRL